MKTSYLTVNGLQQATIFYYSLTTIYCANFAFCVHNILIINMQNDSASSFDFNKAFTYI